MKIVMRKIDELIHPDYNPRQIKEHDFNNLKRSLTEFEAVEPAIVNSHPGREGFIVGGNQRIRAAESLGWKEFPCVIVDLDEKREKELNIRLNKNVGEWDFDQLANHFEAEELVDWGFETWELGHTVEDKTFSVENFEDSPDVKEREIECPNCHHRFTKEKRNVAAGKEAYAEQLASEATQSEGR